ncbi:30S ribosomal protein S8e [Candidatus Woesearchaeota archaeon]|nr:MAG: 30S ribosomal protein S8e [Candidatus Woesearchaeota archaeon]
MVVISRGRMHRKPTGGRYHPIGRKRKYETGSQPTHTKIGKQHIRTRKTKALAQKSKVLVAEFANVFDPKAKKYIKSAIKSVTDSPANRHFVRRNIIVQGTIIQTDAGKARVTSRPGQDGTVNAVLV